MVDFMDMPREAAQIHTKKFVIIGLIAAVISSAAYFIAIPSIIRLFFPHYTHPYRRLK
jgi:hypothetical protein